MAASQAMVDYLRPLVEARRAEPNGDFLSDLVHEEIDGEQLTDSKIYGFLRLLLAGRRGDDVPRDGQLPVRVAVAPRRARARVRRPRRCCPR